MSQEHYLEHLLVCPSNQRAELPVLPVLLETTWINIMIVNDDSNEVLLVHYPVHGLHARALGDEVLLVGAV